jgi:hypothetical protein
MNSSGWKVTNQTPATALGPDAKAQTGMRVYFTTGKGVSADVFVPWADYTPDKVRELVAARVALIDSVHTLAG